MLRYTLVPGRKTKERIAELKKFCIVNRIAEVIFLFNGEELNQGHLSLEETRTWFKTISEAKGELEKENIIISLNPWHTLLHCDRGRRLKPDQHFQLMVDYRGNRADCCVCPLDKNWHKYITELFKLYASIKPNIIWVDDDFRYHNHEPLEWGGCFCQLHLKEFSRRIDKKVSREELIYSILKPGKPHPYRRIWFDLLGDSFINLAALLRKAVDCVSSETKIGLMCSDPIVHSAEGRGWEELLYALAGKHQPILRPATGSYSEGTGLGLHHFALCRHTIACVPQNTRICPEIENFPYSRYSKSVKQTMAQILLCQLTGAMDITLNLFDFMGNGIKSEPDYATMLKENKAYFDGVANLFSEQKKERGIRLIFNPKSSYVVETEEGKNLEEFYSQDRGWAVNLSALGIGYRFDSEMEGEVNAISGTQVLGMNRDKILDLLKRNLLLDGTAAYYLYQMGYGDLIGLKDIEWLELRKSAFSYEEIINQKFATLNARMTAQQPFTKIAALKVRSKSLIISRIHTADRKNSWIGSYLYKNKVGGRIAVFCYPLTNNIGIGFLNRYRQQLLDNVLIWLSNKKEYLCLVRNQPLVYTVRIDFQSYCVLAFLNFSTDSIEELEIYLENFPANLKRCEYLSKKGIWQPFKFKSVEQIGMERKTFKINHRLNYLDFLVLKIKRRIDIVVSSRANEKKSSPES